MSHIRKYAIGIDVSAEDLHVCLSTIDEQQNVAVVASKSFGNRPSGFRTMHRWVDKRIKDQQVRIVWLVEATGVYHEECALYLQEAGLYVSVVLPNKAKKYMQAIGLRSKNDRIDAKGLARMAAEQSLDPWQPMSRFYMRLRTMTRQLQSLQETKTELSNRLHASRRSIYQVDVVIEQLEQLIASIDQQITDMKRAIHQHIQSEPEIADKVGRLSSIKGVGELTAAVILAETNGFALVTNARQLLSYAGYDVVENQSGKHVGKTRISKQGNSRIRRILHFPAFGVVTHQIAPFTRLYERTYARHGIKMKSYVAVQKKLLTILYALWKRGEAFDEQYGQSSQQPPEEDAQKSNPARGGITEGKVLTV
jgi:transposase